MKDYLLIIKTEGSVWKDLSKEQLDHHLKNGGAYIGKLMQSGKLKNANPVEADSSKVVAKTSVSSFNNKELVAGYFHITAKDIDEAVEIAKENPIFEDISTTIEVHPMMPVGGN